MKVFVGMIMLLLLQVVPLSAGATCSGINSSPINLSFSFSDIVVQRDAPIGSVIATSVVDIPNYAACTVGTGQMYFEMIYNGANATGTPGVYKTNVPGVGMSLANENNGGYFYFGSPANFRAISGVGNYGTGYGILKLVKTGDITPGVLASGVVGNIYGDDKVTAIQHSISAVTVVTTACSISTPTIKVPLDDVLASSLTSIGSTAKPKAFDVGLSCNPGARVNAMLTGVQNTDNSAAGVLQLSNAGSEGVATGVGIQILYNNAPLELNKNIVLKTSSGGQETFPFTARYYQTKSTTTAGSANAIATLSLTYQ
jgi:type 1 fimbria pilin